MRIFRLSIRNYIYILLTLIGTAFVDLIYNNNIYALLFLIISDTVMLFFLIDTILTKITVEEDRLVYRQCFRTRCIFYKDIKGISYEKGMKDYQITVRLLKADDIFNFKPLKTIAIKYLIKDYKVLVKLIVEKCKDNPRIIIEQKVLDLIK